MASKIPSAPGGLETVRRFANTLDVEQGTDAISTSKDLGDWLRDQSLLREHDRVTPRHVEAAVSLRTALREAMALNHDRAPASPQVVAVLNDVAGRSRLSLTLDDQGRWVARPLASGADGALGALVAIVYDAMSSGTWSRLKVCGNDECRWAFYDQSRARTGRWCSMQVCGNRMKQQAWRDRHTR